MRLFVNLERLRKRLLRVLQPVLQIFSFQGVGILTCLLLSCTLFTSGFSSFDSPKFGLFNTSEKVLTTKISNSKDLFAILKNKHFDPDSIITLKSALDQVVGKCWFDQKAVLAISYIKYGGKLYPTRASFDGFGKMVAVKFSKTKCHVASVKNKREKIAIVKGFVTSSLGNLLSKSGIPDSLKRETINFARNAGITMEKGEKFSLVYNPQSSKVSAIFVSHPLHGQKGAILYKTKSGPKLFSINGYALKADRVAFKIPVKGRISSGFGFRIHPITRRRAFHYGVDLAAPIGTPVYSAAPGIVTFIGRRGGYGRCIIVKHGSITTLYAHLHSYSKNIQVGKHVDIYSPIATVGNSGFSTGPHLHHEVHNNGRVVNPLTFFKEVRFILSKQEREAFMLYKRKIMAYC